MVHYMFETEWQLTAPIERVFDVLAHPERYQTWWPAVVDSDLLDAGDAGGVGARTAYEIRGPLLYSMRFELKALEVDRPRHIRSVVRGDLIGTGAFFLAEIEGSTHVRFNWYVSTTKTWMNFAAGFAKPLLGWAHHYVMRQGCEAMARHLGARLVSTDSRLVRAPTPVVAPQQ